MHGDRTRVCLCHPLPVRSTRRVRCVPYRCFLTGTQDGAQATGLCAPLVCVCLTSYSRYIFNQPGDPIELAAQLDGSSPTSKECVLLSVLMLKSFRGVQPMITQFLQQLVMIPDNERPSSEPDIALVEQQQILGGGGGWSRAPTHTHTHTHTAAKPLRHWPLQ
jgi:hypothetical protein